MDNESTAPMKKLKVMVSQPMKNLTEHEIKITRDKAIERLTKNGYEIVDSFFLEEWKHCPKDITSEILNIPVFFLAKSIEAISKCDAIYFCKDWNYFNGCRIEHDVAKAYGIKILYEE